jgi:nucleotide sugar dehydrogenase
MSSPEVSIIGLGFVGGAMYKSFLDKKISVFGYDKYNKTIDMGPIDFCLKTEISFLCLPTLFDEVNNCYDKSAIIEVCTFLNDNNYKGIVVLKSTVEPKTISSLSGLFKNLNLVHNPEFLTARTAYNDFHNQKHIVLGKGKNPNIENHIIKLQSFYQKYYPQARISIATSDETESMKIFVNSFYASKIQIFNEFYLLCNKLDINYNSVKELMLKNEWISPHHTQVPGHDGKLSYGGACFPKDTNALLQCMKNNDSPHSVLNSVIEERNKFRNIN